MTLLSIVIIIVINLVYYSINRKCGSLTGERKSTPLMRAAFTASIFRLSSNRLVGYANHLV